MGEETINTQGNSEVGVAAESQGKDDNLTADGWFEQIPEELRKEPSLQSFRNKTVSDIVRSYVEGQKLVGGSIRLPRDDAKPEEWDRFYEKLGRPKTPEEYKIEKPAVIPEGIEWNEDKAKEFQSTAHALGLNKNQVAKLVNWYTDRIGRDMQSYRQKEAEKIEFGKSEAEKEMQKEWGPDYQRRVTVAKRGLRAMGDKNLIELLDTTGIGNHPSFLRLFYSLGQKYAEHGMIDGSVEGTITPDEAKKRIQDIINDSEHLYHPKNAGKPGHKEARQEMEMYHKIAYGVGV